MKRIGTILLGIAVIISSMPQNAYAFGNIYNYSESYSVNTDIDVTDNDISGNLSNDTLPEEEDPFEEISTSESYMGNVSVTGTVNKITWTLYDDGTLIFEGPGVLPAYNPTKNSAGFDTGFTNPPWMEYQDDIRKIIIGDGITGIEKAFPYYEWTTSAHTYTYDISHLVVEELVIGKDVKYIGENAFFAISIGGDESRLYIPKNVKRIEKGAFASARIKSVYFEDNGVEFIGEGAFSYNQILQDIHLPEGLITISDRVFNGTSISEINMPNSVQVVGSSAFESCHLLNTVSWSKSAKSISETCFYNCYGLKTFIIPEGVQKIDKQAFTGCRNLTTVICPDSLTTIDEYAFSGTYQLRKIEMNNVCSIGGRAFSSSGIEKIRIPGTVENIGEKALTAAAKNDGKVENGLEVVIFENGINDIEIPWNLFLNAGYDLNKIVFSKNISKVTGGKINPDREILYVFNCQDIYVYRNSGMDIYLREAGIGVTKYIIDHGRCGDDVDYLITETGKLLIEGSGDIYDYSSEEIPWNSCKDQITSVEISGGVTSIPNNAFSELINLEKIKVADSVQTIGNNVFYNTDFVAECSFGSYFHNYIHTKYPEILIIESWGKCGNTISWIANGETLTISGSGKMYDYTSTTAPWAYLKNTVSKIVIDGNIINIGDYAFYGMSKVRDVVGLDEIKNIGQYAFYGCYQLENVNLEEILSIGSNAFGYCKKLNEVSFGNKLTNLAISAFNKCILLKSIDLPDSIAKIYDYENYSNDSLVWYIGKNDSIKNDFANYDINFICKDELPINIEYVLNGGTNSELNFNSIQGGRYIHLYPASRDGYDFVGWFLDDTYETAVNDSYEITENITVYAKWAPIVYKISYDYSGGNEVSNIEEYTIETETCELCSPTKTNAVFLGWYDENGVLFTHIVKGTIGNIVLKAKWDEASYKIQFMANGGSGSMEIQLIPLNEVGILHNNTFEKKGYSLKNWNTKADGTGKSFSDGESIYKLSTKKDAVIKLYAQWEKEKYTIVYELNGGVQNKKNVATYDVTKKVTLYSPAKVGYTFAGWYLSDDFSGVKQTTIVKGNTGEKYLYASWRDNRYKVVYSKNGSNVLWNLTNKYIDYSEEYALPDEDELSREGYTFAGWNTKSSGTGRMFEPGEFVSELASSDNGSITLYAQWIPDEYSICYYNVDECDNSKNKEHYNTTQKIELKNPIRTGYTFKGWFDNESLSGNKVTKFSAGQIGDKEFYAKWAENSYRLAFNKNGGTLVESLPLTEKYFYSDMVELPGAIVAKKGYWLSGWNTKANGKGTHYDLDDLVFGILSSNGKTVTLYAEWTVNKYDIHYELNGGTNNPANLEYHTSVADLTLKNPTRKGYIFKGWYLDEICSSSQLIKIITKSEDSVTVYAKWKPISYSIIFNKNGGVGNMSSIMTKYDEDCALPTNAFTRKGYEFVGWNTKANGTGKMYSNEEIVSNLTSINGSNVILYAIWEKE